MFGERDVCHVCYYLAQIYFILTVKRIFDNIYLLYLNILLDLVIVHCVCYRFNNINRKVLLMMI